MSFTAVRAALVALLAAVPGVGHVHSYERYAKEEAKFRDLYLYQPPGGEKSLRGWHVRRVATFSKTSGVGRRIEAHTWRVRGYMALSDAASSETVFDGLIEAMRAAVDDNPNLGGLCEPNLNDDGADGLQLLDSAPVLFCGVLCHSATLELKTWSYL